MTRTVLSAATAASRAIRQESAGWNHRRATALFIASPRASRPRTRRIAGGSSIRGCPEANCRLRGGSIQGDPSSDPKRNAEDDEHGQPVNKLFRDFDPPVHVFSRVSKQAVAASSISNSCNNGCKGRAAQELVSRP